MQLRTLIERALHELADDLARSMEQTLVAAIARELADVEEPSSASRRATRTAPPASVSVASTSAPVTRRPTTRTAARNPATAATPPRHAQAAPTTTVRAARRRQSPSPKDLEAPLLALLANGSEKALGTLLHGVGIEPGERWRAQRALASLRTQGRVVLIGERRSARYRLASAVRAAPDSTSPLVAAIESPTHAEDVSRGDEARPTDDDALDLPILRAHARAGAVVVMGGIVEPDAVDTLRGSTGLALDWVAIPIDDAAAVVARLAERVRAGDVAALVVLDALVTGAQVRPLADAASERGLAVSFAGTGNVALLRRALIELDEHVASTPHTAG
ncbi:MAG: hypothetical protein ACHREM_28935 [Polyangiales bacterium]